MDEFEIFVQEESFEALSRSSLEAELANKEKEVNFRDRIFVMVYEALLITFVD